LTATLIVSQVSEPSDASDGLGAQVWTYLLGLFVLVSLFCLYVLQSSSHSRKLRSQLLETREDLISTTVSKSYVDNILKSMAQTLMVIDPDGTIQRVNQAASGLLGYESVELVGRSAADVFEEGIDVLSLFKQPDGNDVIRSIDTNVVTKDGRDVAVSLSGSVMRDDDGEIQGMVCVAQDITDRKEALEMLERQTEELARSNSELEQFAWVASHDLQEPLRMVASYTQLLAKRYQGKLDSDADEFIEFAVDGAARMRRLINDLLELSRVGTRGKDFQATDCEAIYDRTLVNLQALVDDSDALVTHDRLPTVIGDGTQLGQLFQNLIGNAIKFRRDDEQLTVHVGAERQDGNWVISVRDNGIGIDPQYAERIFVVFQRLHGKGDRSGTGIGLAVCKKIVERHGGRIWVTSLPDEGSTFYFTLPVNEENSSHE
jgi:PAS domain S-box-containing protein